MSYKFAFVCSRNFTQALAVVSAVAGLAALPTGALAADAADSAGSEPAAIVRVVPETKEARLERVAYRLRAASAGRCKVPEMLTGLSLHDLGAYDAKSRAAMLAARTLTTGFGVRGVVAGSVGEAAGLAVGDEIVEVNGRALETFAPGAIARKASSERTERFEDWLGSELASGAATLLVRRGDETRQISLSGQPGCGGKPVFYERGGLNAWSDGKYVAVTGRMMAFAREDSELAFVVAHEMSHNILGHAEQVRGTSMLLAEFGFGSRKVKRTEVEADGLAAEVILAAGFDTQGAVAILQRSGRARPFELALTHPGPSRRIAIVNAVLHRSEQAVPIELAATPAPILSLLLLDQARARSPEALSAYGMGSFPLEWSLATFGTARLAQSGSPHAVIQATFGDGIKGKYATGFVRSRTALFVAVRPAPLPTQKLAEGQI